MQAATTIARREPLLGQIDLNGLRGYAKRVLLLAGAAKRTGRQFTAPEADCIKIAAATLDLIGLEPGTSNLRLNRLGLDISFQRPLGGDGD